MRKSKKTGIAGIIITIVILIVIVIISNIKIDNVAFIESSAGIFVMPIQNGLTYLKNWMSGNNTFFTNFSKMFVCILAYIEGVSPTEMKKAELHYKDRLNVYY